MTTETVTEPEPTVITCKHDDRPEHVWQPGEGCPDAIPAGTWAVRPASRFGTPS